MGGIEHTRRFIRSHLKVDLKRRGCRLKHDVRMRFLQALATGDIQHDGPMSPTVQNLLIERVVTAQLRHVFQRQLGGSNTRQCSDHQWLSVKPCSGVAAQAP